MCNLLCLLVILCYSVILITSMGSVPLTLPYLKPSLDLGVRSMQFLFVCRTRAGRAPRPLLVAEVRLGVLSHPFGFTLPRASSSRE